MSAYLTDYLEQKPPPVVSRLRKIKDQLAAYPPEERDAALQRILTAEKQEAAVPVG